MKTHTRGIEVIGRAAALGLLMLALLSGCGGGQRDDRPAGSGNPEADHRAEQRVGKDTGNDKDSKDAKRERTLYERLGGEAGIRAIVADFTTRSVADPRVNFERRNVSTNWLGQSYKPWNPTPQNVERLQKHMVEFLTLASGGPAAYTGRDFRPLHAGMRITNNEFDAMVGDIKASLDKLGIAPREQKELLAIIETTRKEIVEKT
jgi:hemoglobin